MSRIGNAPVEVAQGVEVTINKSSLTVKGKLGELTQELLEGIKVEQNGNQLIVSRTDDSKDLRAKHGLLRALINNMVVGVSEGYETKQELVGVGYRAVVKGDLLELSLGYSHNIIFQLPSEVKATAEQAKGKPPIVTFKSHDKQLIGMVAAKLRSLRKPEPYKGKGIKYVGESLRRKAGKSAAK
jgi:large subunit ribosomal protein L6